MSSLDDVPSRSLFANFTSLLDKNVKLDESSGRETIKFNDPRLPVEEFLEVYMETAFENGIPGAREYRNPNSRERELLSCAGEFIYCTRCL